MIVGVLVELSNKNIDRIFDYIVPSNLESKIKIGVRVTVPFHNQILEGFILSINKNKTDRELKEVINVIDDEIILDDELLELGSYMSKKTLSTLISCYQVMLPKALKAQAKTSIHIKREKIIKLGINYKELINYKLTDKQMNMVNLVYDKKQVSRKELVEISSSILKKLLDKKILIEIEKEVYRLTDDEHVLLDKYSLTSSQQKVVDTILNNKELPKTYLLHGVTGSGKTEVYIEIIKHVLKNNKTALMLVPEISLTPQMVSRFTCVFGDNIAVLHSGLSNNEKFDEYRKIIHDEINERINLDLFC